MLLLHRRIILRIIYAITENTFNIFKLITEYFTALLQNIKLNNSYTLFFFLIKLYVFTSSKTLKIIKEREITSLNSEKTTRIKYTVNEARRLITLRRKNML